jgi:tRNA (cmo5U34)-methyltransferase
MIKPLKTGKWTFGENVYKEFNSHIEKSIPSYLKTQKLISELSTYFLREDSVCYDIGFSTGTLLVKINNLNLEKKINFIGIEPEINMLRSFKKTKQFKKITLINKVVENIKMKKSDYIISHYTLQFIRQNLRLKILRKIYNSLNPGGGFILFEKIYANNSRFEKIFSDMLVDFKSANNFSEKEIINKNKSIRGILESLTTNQNIKNLKNAGFKNTQIIHQDINFIGILSIK